MKKFITSFLAILVIMLGFTVNMSESAESTWLARSWLTKGNGWAEKGIVRINGDDRGSLLFGVSFDAATDTHFIVSMDIDAELNMSDFNIEAWDFSQATDFGSPIPVPKTEPTASRPFKLTVPSFRTSVLNVYSYELSVTSASSGSMKLSGELLEHGIDFDLENVIWQRGTPEPEDPDNKSGCNTLFGLTALLPSAFLALKKRAEE